MEIERIVHMADPQPNQLIHPPHIDPHQAANPQPANVLAGHLMNTCNHFLNMNWRDHFKVFLILFFAIMTALAWVIHQKPKPQPSLCDLELHVALDGSALYRTISEAVDATPTLSNLRTCIIIKEGIYEESIIVPLEKVNLAFIGDGMNKSILTSNNLFRASSTGTLKILGRGFLGMNLAIVNTANPEQGKEAIALENWGDESVFYRCHFVGNRRTLYAVAYKQLYRENEIQGSLFFIYGEAHAVFQKCIIVTIQNGEEESVVSGNIRRSLKRNSAFVFQMCEFIKPVISSTIVTTPVYLGAPLTTYSTVVVMESYLDSLVVGWKLFSPLFPSCPNTTFLAEYKNNGLSTRNQNVSNCIHIIEESIARQFLKTFFNESLLWIPNQIPFDANIH